MQYAVVDVETAGQSNKITEIAIYVYDDEKKEVVEEFSSLVNPECSIPSFITNLTGINDDMVAAAPRFFEIAKQVFTITENRVFVAHSVGFDYNVIRNEFKELGADFRRKKVCTVRLSRKIFPGKKSYSLGKLCESLDIPIFDRHRATGDAKATTILLERLLNHDDSEIVSETVKTRNKEGSLPPNLPKETFDNLPDQPGVYFMHNEEGKVIYVGKAKEIKSRIAGHFADNSISKLKFKNQIFDISYQITGSEFLALLVESVEIKNHFPEFNRAQKYTGTGYALCKYEDQNGVFRLEVVKSQKYLTNAIASFSNTVRARDFLQNLVNEHQLCGKMTGLQNTASACFDYHLGKCLGVCIKAETAEKYNQRVEKAIEGFTLQCGTYLVWLPGKTRFEKAFIYIENGIYKGYGFVDESTQANGILEMIESHLIPQKHNVDVQHILNSWLQKMHPSKIIKLENSPAME
ncbi:MAG: GIY-YIG nuclease family protein [Flavobacteriales bacterium]|nr:GIY-YIG nuclease family protein [Flavobacteriales bacterium]